MSKIFSFRLHRFTRLFPVLYKWSHTACILFLSLSLITIFISLSACKPKQKKIEEKKPQLVEVTHVRQGEIAGKIEFTGSIQAETEVKVFPNPVRPDFNNLLMIMGLVQYGQVKITDVSGNLVYQSRAQGGSISWDLIDVRGKKVSSGVYLIFSSNDDGSETFVGKFAVVK